VVIPPLGTYHCTKEVDRYAVENIRSGNRRRGGAPGPGLSVAALPLAGRGGGLVQRPLVPCRPGCRSGLLVQVRCGQEPGKTGAELKRGAAGCRGEKQGAQRTFGCGMISVASFEGGELLTTKHQQLLEYIEQLPLGSKISVRQMARTMGVSEGTAYRAIKEAEARGLVSAMPRVGTVRIEVKEEHNIQRLTFAEVVNIVDGAVLGGRAGLHKALSKFVIGAMKIESMARYIEANSLLIVGDREDAQRLALSRGPGVLK